MLFKIRLGEGMKNEVNYEKIEEIRKSGDSGRENVDYVCSYFGLNRASKKQLEKMIERNVPFSEIIAALDKGLEHINGYGGRPEITKIFLDTVNGRYAIIVTGNAEYPDKCGFEGIKSIHCINNGFRARQVCGF